MIRIHLWMCARNWTFLFQYMQLENWTSNQIGTLTVEYILSNHENAQNLHKKEVRYK